MRVKKTVRPDTLPKSPTGIKGLDEITDGGLPTGRPTLVAGGPGAGKTLLATEFLVRGATDFNEPGVFMTFEETLQDLTQNVASLGFDLPELIKQKNLRIDYVRVERSEIEETGEYDLEGLFIRLNHAIDSIGAKRVVLDTIESLFAGLKNDAILRAELRRLFKWLKEKGVTVIITGEQGERAITRQGLEEYVSDCVILLDHRVENQISTRRLRIVKYRGSTHGTNEYPYIIDHQGITVMPVTSLKLEHEASSERVSSGISSLDEMLGGKGFFRGSTVLVSGTAGTGKSSLGSHMARATCEQGERCLYLAFEESPQQIMRNMRSIGINLEPYVKNGLLKFQASRPSLHGLEMHLLTIHKQIEAFKPSTVIVDPITNLITSGNLQDVKGMLTRLIDYLKMSTVTTVMTSLTQGNFLEQTDVGVSSLVDTWIMLRDLEHSGERNRGLYILKSRGMPHSNQIREFIMTDHGVELIDVYIGAKGVLTGSARIAQEHEEQVNAKLRLQDLQRGHDELQKKRDALEAQITALRAEFAAEEEQVKRDLEIDKLRERSLVENRAVQMKQRQHRTYDTQHTKRRSQERKRNG